MPTPRSAKIVSVLLAAFAAGCIGAEAPREDSVDDQALINQPANTSCTLDIQCQGSLVCKPTSGYPTGIADDNRCLAPGGAKAVCAEDTDCQKGLICFGSDSHYAGTCVAGNAKSCSWDIECPDSLICTPIQGYPMPIDQDNHCVAPGKGEAACAEDADCARGYVCIGAEFYAGKCIAGDAKPCSWDVECSGSLVCTPIAGYPTTIDKDNRCLLPGVANAPCAEDSDCAAGLICSGADASYAGKCR